MKARHDATFNKSKRPKWLFIWAVLMVMVVVHYYRQHNLLCSNLLTQATPTLYLKEKKTLGNPILKFYLRYIQHTKIVRVRIDVPKIPAPCKLFKQSWKILLTNWIPTSEFEIQNGKYLETIFCNRWAPRRWRGRNKKWPLLAYFVARVTGRSDCEHEMFRTPEYYSHSRD